MHQEAPTVQMRIRASLEQQREQAPSLVTLLRCGNAIDNYTSVKSAFRRHDFERHQTEDLRLFRS